MWLCGLCLNHHVLIVLKTSEIFCSVHWLQWLQWTAAKLICKPASRNMDGIYSNLQFWIFVFSVLPNVLKEISTNVSLWKYHHEIAGHVKHPEILFHIHSHHKRKEFTERHKHSSVKMEKAQRTSSVCFFVSFMCAESQQTQSDLDSSSPFRPNTSRKRTVCVGMPLGIFYRWWI